MPQPKGDFTAELRSREQTQWPVNTYRRQTRPNTMSQPLKFFDRIKHVPVLLLIASAFAVTLLAEPATAQPEPKPPATYPALPSEIPAKFEPTNEGFDHVKRDVMIPMRDGVKLHTVILIPKGAERAPMLLTRTPYNADKLTSHAESAHLG